MDITLPDGTVIRGVPEGTTKEQLIAKLTANGYDVSKLFQPALHGPELAAQREADALRERAGAYAPAGDPLAKHGALARKPDLFDAAMAGQIPKEQPKSLQQDIADRLGAGADMLMAPLNSRDVPPDDLVNAAVRMAVEPLARLPEALVRDPVKTIAQDYNPIYQASMGYKDVESGVRSALQGDFSKAGTEAVQGATQIMGGALGLMGLKGGPKVPGRATTLAEAERMAAGPRMPPVDPAAAPPAPTTPPAAMTYEDVAELVRTAARGGMGSQQAVEKLARAAPLNKDAAAAAARLGIDVPPDVLLDHSQLKEAIGLTRSMPGTLASASWADAVERAATKADEAMALIDGSPDLSEVSKGVLDNMNATKTELERQAKEIYKRIDAKIRGGAAPPAVDLVNSRRLMNEIMAGLDDPSLLTPLEKILMNMSSPGRKKPPTYDAMMRLKNDIGQAVEKASGIYADMNTGILKRLYSALAEDQLYNVQQIGGKQLRDNLRLANQIYAKQSALGKRIVSLFGDERDGSIAQKLLTTIKSGSKGDITGFNRIVSKLPQDLRRKAVATAIAAASREAKTDGFGFAKYVTLYQGIRNNSEVYKTVVKTLGSDGDKFLRDLYEVSKRITEARENVKTTGQANQALVQGMMAEGLVQKVMQSSVGRQTTMGGATVLGGAMAGPAAGAASAMLVNTLSKASKNTINAAGDLFASPEWQQLVAKVAAEDRVDAKAFNAARMSKAFRTWAKTAGITDPDAWLRNALAVSIGTGFANKAGQPVQPYEATYGRQATE